MKTFNPAKDKWGDVANDLNYNFSKLSGDFDSLVNSGEVIIKTNLTTNLSLTSSQTLIIEQGGSISSTVTGDGTKLIIKRGGSFLSGATMAGTWDCEEVNPEWFGAVGGGVTDDYVAINKAFNFARLTKARNVVFNYNTTYRSDTKLWLTDLNINGNFSTIIHAEGIATQASYRSLSSAVTLADNCFKGDSWIKCSDAAFLATLQPNDLLKIISDEILQVSSNENAKPGEIHEIREVDEVSGIIYFNDYLFWNYDVSKNARIFRIVPSYLSVKNISIKVESIRGSEVTPVVSNIGMYLAGVRDLQIDNVNIEAYSVGIGLHDCYKPTVRAKTFKTERPGYGYGVNIAGATMYADVSGVFIGARHCITTGKGGVTLGSNEAGVSWVSVVHDSIGTSSLNGSAIFDTHATSGSIYFENCVAIGGVFRELVAQITEWASDVNYTTDDIVRSVNKNLFLAKDNSLNVNPDTYNTKWVGTNGNTQVGFKCEGLYNYINNCRAFGCWFGITLSSVDGVETLVKNFDTRSCARAVSSSVSTYIRNLSFENIFGYDESFLDGVLFYMQGKYDNWHFSNINSRNMVLFFTASTLSVLNKSLYINGFSCKFSDEYKKDGWAIWHTVGGNNVKNIILQNGNIENTQLFYSYDQAATANLEQLIINNVFVNAPQGDVIKCEHRTDYIAINNVNVTTPASTDYFLYIKKSANGITINNSGYYGTNATKLIYTHTTSTVGYFAHSGNIFPALTTPKTGTGITNAYELLSGSIGILRAISGNGSPENVHAAPVGVIYHRLDGGEDTTLYIKELGTGNTGWKAK